MCGNEGDDWIEFGILDGAAGDNFDPFGPRPVIGNDVFIGDGGADDMDGEGGDDIMVGNGGQGDQLSRACPASTGRPSRTIRSA